MDEDTLNRVVKRYYGHSIDEMDVMIGYWLNKYHDEKRYSKDLEKQVNTLKHKINVLNQYKLLCNTHFGTKVNPIQQTQRLKQLEYENSQLKNKLEKVTEYVIKEQRTILDCEVVYTDTLLKILKGDE